MGKPKKNARNDTLQQPSLGLTLDLEYWLSDELRVQRC